MLSAFYILSLFDSVAERFRFLNVTDELNIKEVQRKAGEAQKK